MENPRGTLPAMAGEPADPYRLVSPWRRFHLRRNPFGEPPAEDAGDLVVLPDGEDLVRTLRRPGAAIQILGHQGRGKTARMRFLQRRFPECPYVYLAEDEPLPDLPKIEPRSGGGPALLLDEAQRLPPRRRRRLFRRTARVGAALALTSHEDLAREMEAGGLTTRTVRVEGLTVDHLLAVVERRLEWARAAPGPIPGLDRTDARRLVDRFGDDLRSLLDHLYETYQDRLHRHEEETPWRSAI